MRFMLRTTHFFTLSLVVVLLFMEPFSGSPWALEKSVINSLGMEFVLIPAGTFIMGSPLSEKYRDESERPHEVTITRAFYMQTTEVTQGQWRAVMGDNPSRFKKCGGDCPVEKVSWYDSQRFIKKINALGKGKYRLPTEAEWEYACRAGTQTSYSWGEDIDCSKAMYRNNPRRGFDDCVDYIRQKGLSVASPAPVKSYPHNSWGLYDMHGNLWEWVQDWFGDYPSGSVKDPKGPSTGSKRVRRGGSWFKYGSSCRCANRANANPASRFYTTGFRLVREP